MALWCQRTASYGLWVSRVEDLTTRPVKAPKMEPGMDERATTYVGVETA